jgi:hypothetical protein
MRPNVAARGIPAARQCRPISCPPAGPPVAVEVDALPETVISDIGCDGCHLCLPFSSPLRTGCRRCPPRPSRPPDSHRPLTAIVHDSASAAWSRLSRKYILLATYQRNPTPGRGRHPMSPAGMPTPTMVPPRSTAHKRHNTSSTTWCIACVALASCRRRESGFRNYCDPACPVVSPIMERCPLSTVCLGSIQIRGYTTVQT